MRTSELLDIVPSYTPAPDIRPILLDTRRDAVIWEGDHNHSRDRASEIALAKLDELETCAHCGRGASFLEMIEDDLIPWCSLLEAEAFYSTRRIP